MEDPERCSLGTSGGDESNLFSAYSIRPSAILRDAILRIQKFFPCTGRKLQLLAEYARSAEFGKMIGQLFQITLIAVCNLLLMYPIEQLIIECSIFFKYWDVTALVAMLYFSFYLMDRLLLLDVAAIGGIQPVVRCLFYGMDGMQEKDIKIVDKPILSVLVVGTSAGTVQLVYTLISVDKRLPHDITQTEQLNINTIASTNDCNTAVPISPTGSLTLDEIGDILRIVSKCLNYALQFISNGAMFLSSSNYIRKIVNEHISSTAERKSFLQKLGKTFESFSKDARLWVKIYFWVLYFYDLILETSFLDMQDAIDLSGIRYGLGILSMAMLAITYCYIKYFK